MAIHLARTITFLCGVAVLGCGTAAVEHIVELQDARGDTRLQHPQAPGLSAASFDLVGVSIQRRGGRVIVEATFAAPVKPWPSAIPTELDQQRARYPQTVDIYIDAGPGGHVAALPGRGFYVPAAEGWDKALVLAALHSPLHPDAALPQHLSARGRTLRGVFPASAVPRGARGFVAVVLATSLDDTGWVRGVSSQSTDCQTWVDQRCKLVGQGPPVLDSTSDVAGDVIGLLYPTGVRPKGQDVPVVFQRGALVTAAPITDRITVGAVATLHDAQQRAIGSAVVESVTGDTAVMRVLGETPPNGAASVTFGGSL